nr:hypothetical protein [Thermoflexales bacterium]
FLRQRPAYGFRLSLVASEMLIETGPVMTKRPAVAGPQTVVTLPIDTTFKVQLVEAAKPTTRWDQWRPRVMVLFAAVLLVACLLWLAWLRPVIYSGVLKADAIPELSLTLAYPQYVSRGDEGTIDLTATNVASQTITGTVIVDFAPAPQIIQVEDSTNVLKFESLPQGGKQTLHVRYRLAQPMDFGSDTLAFTPRVVLETGISADYGSQTINITFLPLVRTILTGAFGLSALAGLFWDQIKKRLFPSD